jgi:hypothetical protein
MPSGANFNPLLQRGIFLENVLLLIFLKIFAATSPPLKREFRGIKKFRLNRYFPLR